MVAISISAMSFHILTVSWVQFILIHFSRYTLQKSPSPERGYRLNYIKKVGMPNSEQTKVCGGVFNHLNLKIKFWKKSHQVPKSISRIKSQQDVCLRLVWRTITEQVLYLYHIKRVQELNAPDYTTHNIFLNEVHLLLPRQGINNVSV